MGKSLGGGEHPGGPAFIPLARGSACEGSSEKPSFPQKEGNGHLGVPIETDRKFQQGNRFRQFCLVFRSLLLRIRPAWD